MKPALKTLANRVATAAGGTLVSTNAFAIMAHQRLALLAEAATLYRSTLKGKGATGIVFSFNRPVQLHATLASYLHHVQNPSPLIVQYRSTNERATKAYNELKKLFAKAPITWVEETTCRATLLEILEGLTTPKLFFLVDDDIFVNPVDMAAFTAINPLEYVPSLRLHPGLSQSYTMRMAQPAPQLEPSTAHKDMQQWTWGAAGNEWDYPYSVEGHLFDTAEILMMTRASPFKAPNTYEGVLHGFAAHARPRPGLCFKTPVLFNNPCNKVQVENDNHAGLTNAFSPEAMLDQWEYGKQIDFLALAGTSYPAPHWEVPMSFIQRG